jgi:hypothetical protein
MVFVLRMSPAHKAQNGIFKGSSTQWFVGGQVALTIEFAGGEIVSDIIDLHSGSFTNE